LPPRFMVHVQFQPHRNRRLVMAGLRTALGVRRCAARAALPDAAPAIPRYTGAAAAARGSVSGPV